MRLSSRFPARNHRHYAYYLSGAFISQIGNQVQDWAIAWHVYTLTGSSFMVGLVGAVKIVPSLLLSLFGGVVADQLDRRKIILITQSLFSLVALTLAAITHSGSIQLLHIYAAVAVYGAIRAFEVPARQAIVPSLVPRSVFPNAVTLNSLSWRTSEVLGPLITGILVASGGLRLGPLAMDGITSCYALNLLSFGAILLAVWQLPPRVPKFADGKSERINSVNEILPFLAEGIRFVRRSRVVRSSMWIDFWATFFSSADALLPAFATKIFSLGGTGFGILAGSISVGSLIASVVMAFSPTPRRQGKWVIISIAAYGLFTLLFGLSNSFTLALIFLALTGAADTVSTILRVTIRQLSTPDRMRGRMTAVAVLFHRSGPQLGDFEAGTVARAFGERASVIIGGIASLLVSSIWWRSRDLKEYEHTEEASELQTSQPSRTI